LGRISERAFLRSIHFLFRHPRRSHIRNIFFEPLSNQVWWCVLVLVTGSTLLLLIHVRQERMLSHMDNRLSFVWFTMLETYLQQGPANEIFRLFSTRLLISFSCIFSFMLMQFYGAFIVGSLLSESSRSIVNLQALYDSNLAIGMENISYNFPIFTNTSNQLVKGCVREENLQVRRTQYPNPTAGSRKDHPGKICIPFSYR